MDKEVTQELQENLKAVSEHFALELTKLRTGRAHPSMVEDLMVEAYGVKTPLKQLSTVSTPEAQLIQISPFDPSTMQDIVSSIRNNPTLGLNPTDDGRVVRIQIPTLTEERRMLIVKQLGEKLEDSNIGLRKARHDAMSTVDKAKKEKTIGEDEAKRLQNQIDEIINKTKSELDSLAKDKEKDILSV